MSCRCFFIWFCPSSAVMESDRALAFILLFSATLASCCDGGKVLVYPVDGSHWLNMKILVEALHSQGHQITVLRSTTSWYVSEISPHYSSITVQQEQAQNLESQSFMTSFLKRSGEHGVVVMTLGTLLSELGPEISEIIASAFANLPQKVVWRHTGKRPVTLGNNTMLVKWLPYDNMVRLRARGVAEIVEVTTMDVESLTSTLRNIVDPEKPYKQNMVKLSI
ncbi:UDP-glucuronosyltransferase 2B13-like [Hippoglossus hippoglossus]|uniref:UDP-glucuronosyltransferase 2B13-like n=1 Tax=Hippoglossus hippoglossus TaxID=8267 RepID=UPI00148E4A14|nr:UDP-glucuronosyltransferase 2B13-like [Hippoglossus hippoglossus]